MLDLLQFTRADFPQLIGWVDSAELLMTIAGPKFDFPLTIDQLDRYLLDQKSLSFKVVHLETGESIGHAEIILGGDGTCKIDKVLIGDKSTRGKGLGQELMCLLVKKAFEQPDIYEVELNVYDWNIAGIRVYEKTGFVMRPERNSSNEVNNQVWTAINMVMRRIPSTRTSTN